MYKKIKCPECFTFMRPKEQSDWKVGEKLSRGFHPDVFIYWICDKCERSWIE